MDIHAIQLKPIVLDALHEDWGYGDWTTNLCVDKDKQAKAKIICRRKTLVAGVDVARVVFQEVDPTIVVKIEIQNAQIALENEVVMTLEGHARGILKAERVALNFLAKMSGIADLTRQFVLRIAHTPTQLLDTRKTTPGLRLLEKYSAFMGGARNHRMCLSDGVIVKENHIQAAGGIAMAMEKLLKNLPPTIKIEIETTSLQEVQEALDAGADLIMLDNMNLLEISKAVKIVCKRTLIEVSGNICLENIASIAETGVDFISTGSIFHSSSWADYSLLFLK